MTIYKADLPEEKYDFAIITGVLEYIPYYHSDFTATSIQNTVITFLKKVSKTLKENGILFLAIENKFGAKYFSGCSEDHNEQFFSGIMGYPFKSAITFSKPELTSFLQDSGFLNIQFYHCFPDYKLPKLFIRECKDFYDVAPSGLWRGYFEDYTTDRRYLFSESLFLDNLTRSQLLFEMSNSFVVLASKSNDINLQTDWIMKKFFNSFPNNTQSHHTVEIIRKQGKVDKNQYYVKREPLKIANAAWEFSGEEYAYHLTDKSDFIKGESLYIKLVKALWSQDFNELIHILNLIKTNLLEQFPTNQYDEENYQLSNYPVDYTAWNLIENSKGELAFIDKKWITKKRLPIDFIIFRTLLYTLYEESPALNKSRHTIKNWIIDLMKQIFPNYDYDRFMYNLALETDFLAFATGENKANIAEMRKKIFFSAPYAKRLKDRLIEVQSELEQERQNKADLQAKIDSLNQEIEQERQNKADLQAKINELTKEIAKIYSSKSWMITKPLRWARQKLRKVR